MKVLFLEKQFDEESFEPGVDVPVEEAKIVSHDVISKVREFGGLSPALGESVASQLPSENLAADEGQLVDSGKKIWTE